MTETSTSETSHDISTLDILVETAFHSVDVYTKAAKDSENSRFDALFISGAGKRRDIASRLQQEVTALGDEPDDDGTELAVAHGMFLKLKSAVTGSDDKAIINKVEAFEDHINAKFENALDDMELSPTVRDLTEKCYTSVKAGHDEMRAIKPSMEG